VVPEAALERQAQQWGLNAASGFNNAPGYLNENSAGRRVSSSMPVCLAKLLSPHTLCIPKSKIRLGTTAASPSVAIFRFADPVAAL